MVVPMFGHPERQDGAVDLLHEVTLAELVMRSAG